MQRVKHYAKKVYRKLRWRNSLQYWEEAAKKNPYRAICDGISTEEEFDEQKDSILFASSVNYKNKVVLDLCCGLGRIARFITEDVKLYLGVDFSPTMIEKAKQRYRNKRNVKFILNDGKTLKELSDATVDICVCELGFQHVNKNVTVGYVKEVYRVLKPNGVFLAQIPRLNFYKNGSYAFTDQDTIALFQGFRIFCLRDYAHSHAYHLVKATK